MTAETQEVAIICNAAYMTYYVTGSVQARYLPGVTEYIFELRAENRMLDVPLTSSVYLIKWHYVCLTVPLEFKGIKINLTYR